MQTPTTPAMFDIARRGRHQFAPVEPIKPRKRPSILAKALFPIRAMRKGKLGALPICFLHHLSYKEVLQLEQESRPYMYDAFIQPCTWVSSDYQHCPMDSKVTAKYIQRDSTAPLQRILWSSSRVGVYYNPESSTLDANDLQQLIRDLRRWHVPLCPHTDMDDPELLAQLGTEASTRVANDEHALGPPLRCSNKYCRTYFYFSHYHMARTRGSAICLETRRFIDFAATDGFLPDAKHNLWLESTMGYRKLWEWMCRNAPAQVGGLGYFAAPDSLVALPPGEKGKHRSGISNACGEYAVKRLEALFPLSGDEQIGGSIMDLSLSRLIPLALPTSQYPMSIAAT